MQIVVDELRKVLNKLFLKYGFNEDKAQILAEITANNTLDGVNSHGINRVPLFIDYVKNGVVKVNAEAEKIASFGSIERWDGHYGSGVINASKCTERAIALAKDQGMGLVALRNTNHWMRGGAYGWQAAESGCISILFTNTKPNMPPWGGKESRIGNNPFIVAIPREEGHVVLDMAISQFAFGKINDYKLKGEKLPFYGGWNDEDQLSMDPEEISSNERGLPIGFWKGSALSMVLDILATLLSAGSSTGQIGTKGYETGISQVFLCIYPELFGDKDIQDKLLDEIINYTREVEPMKPGDHIYYPGERTLQKRRHNSTHGITVNDEIWSKIMALLD